MDGRSRDTAQVNGYFAMPEIRSLIPRDMTLMWSIMPATETADLFELYAIKTDYSRRAPLGGNLIVDAEAFSDPSSYAGVSVVMNDLGASR